MATLNFNAQTVAPAEAFTALPAGVYAAQVIESELKPTKNGTGHYLQLTWKVLDGQHTGRLIFDRLNIANANETAQKIGQQQLSALCHAVGVLQVADRQQLHNKPCLIKVTVRQDPQYGDSNEVKGYEPAGGAAAASTMPAFAKPAAAPAAGSPPWAKAA
jgi:hypothetical protein